MPCRKAQRRQSGGGRIKTERHGDLPVAAIPAVAACAKKNFAVLQRRPRPAHYSFVQELLAFLSSGFGVFFGVVFLALVFGAGLLVWWSRKID